MAQRGGALWLRTGTSDFISVELAQLFVSRRLDEPETGNDAPNQRAGHENPQRWQETGGEQRHDSDQPDNGQGNVEDEVVDADDEVFHRACSLREVIKPPIRGGAHAITSRHDFEQQGPLKERDYLKRIYRSRDAERL